MNGKTDILGGSELNIEQFELTVIDGPDKGRTLTSTGDDIVIGSAEGADLKVSDKAVSGFHCRLSATPHGIRVTDEGSTNGTFLQGVRIESAFLGRHGALTLGRSMIDVAVLDSVLTAPLSPAPSFGGALGRSAEMRRIFAILSRVAAVDSTVLFEGETGTGKGVLAKAVHDQSPRAAQPFVVVDCTALPPGLFESELFGHVEGAYTGAERARDGLFVDADGGTVFLDEIGELPLDLQPKLLRVLEGKKVRPVGGSESRAIDVRVIAATNRNLHREVNDGHFRSDLFYRLGGFRIRIPPLRDRRDDIAPLVRHFYAMFTGGNEPSDEFIAPYTTGSWPGNIRELRAAIERATLLGDLHQWTQANTPAESDYDPDTPFRVAKMAAVSHWEQTYLASLMEHHEGNVSRAARGARMDRSYLRQLLKRHGLRG